MATQPKPVQSMAQFVDSLLMAGTTWSKLEARCKEEAAKRGTTTLSQLGQIKAHVKFRAKQTTKYWVEHTDIGVRMNVLAQPAKEKPVAKAKAKPAPKKAKPNGKPVGRAVKKTTKEQRQTVEPVAEQPAPDQAA